MPRFALVQCAVLLATQLAARYPGSAYLPPGPDIAALLPFTAAESAAFKKLGVKRVECTLDKEFITVFQLDADGRVVRSEEFILKKKTRTLGSNCDYRYNPQGQLVSRLNRDKMNVDFDTIAYDGNGHIIYYLSTKAELKGRKPPKVVMTYHHLRLDAASGAGNRLQGVGKADTCLYTFDTNNELVRREGYSLLDSVSTAASFHGGRLRRHWYRWGGLPFHLGLEEFMKEGRLITRSRWAHASIGPIGSAPDDVWNDTTMVEQVNHTYDDEGRLIRRWRANIYQPKEFFTYYEHGLLMEHVTLNPQFVNVERYLYWFQ